MGPPKLPGIQLTNDEKSLAQLVKFHDEYCLIRDILEEDDKAKIILDRTSFGEFIWTKYWSRTGKYTDYVTSDEFIGLHKELMAKSIYIDFWMSDIDRLKARILESPEDEKIFTQGGRTIEENVKWVYDMYEDLAKIIKKNGIDYAKIDSSTFTTIQDDIDHINALCRLG